MDPEERQRQREARRKARQERMTAEENEGISSRRESTKPDEQDEIRQREEAEKMRREAEEAERLKREADEAEEVERERQQREAEERRRRQAKEEEEEEERRREEEEQKRKEEEEEARIKEQKEKEEAELKKKKPKRKGLGGLSVEKKRMLKQLIMQKAAEEMKEEARKRQEKKENHLKSVVPSLEIETDDKDKMIAIVKKLYEKLCILEGEKFDWEAKNRNMEYEINELSLKVNNVKGKFVKPVLKRVSKNEVKWSKIQKNRQEHISFRDQLKSTGQNKFTLDDKSGETTEQTNETEVAAE